MTDVRGSSATPTQQQIIDREVKAEQIRQIYQTSIPATAIVLINAAILAAMQWTVIDHRIILGWLTYCLLICGYRIISAQRHLAAFNLNKEFTAAQERDLTIVISLFSLLWVSSALLLFPSDNLIHQFFLTFVLAGITSGAVTSIGIDNRLLRIYLIPVISVMSIRLLMEQSLITTAMAILAPVYLIALLVFAGKMSKQMIENVEFRIQSEHDAHELRLGDTAFEANEPMLVTDAQGLIIRSNHAFSELTGYSLKELIGKTTRILNSEYHDEAFYNKIWETVERSGKWEGEIWSRDKQGQAFPAWMIATLVREGDGEISNYIASYTDISELKSQHELLALSTQMEKTLGQLLQLSLQDQPLRIYLDNALTMLLTTVTWLRLKPQGAIFVTTAEEPEQLVLVAEHNLEPQLKKMCQQVPFGHCLCGRVAQSCTPLFVDHIDEQHDNYFNGLEEHGHYVLPLLQGDELLGVITLYTEYQHPRSEIELEFLKRVAHIISLGITRRYSDMRMIEAREIAEKASQAKSEFLSNMSHELRTPLNAIMGFSQLLGMELEDPAQLDQVHEIHRASHHLLDLINEILDLAKIEAGKMELVITECPVVYNINDCIALTQSMAERRHVDLINHVRNPNLSVRADAMRLKQIMLNLITNGIKYNIDGGVVRIDIEQRPNGNLRLLVTDTGPGLSDEQCELLFQPFERLGQQHKAIEGTGIGLVITRRLVELMGGQIGVNSTPGVGSTFWVELPMGEHHHPDTQPGGQEQAHAEQNQSELLHAQPIILYIEDNPINIKLVEKLLEKRGGIRLITALDPGTGLLLASEQQPELILLDINLPDMDGFEVHKRLLENPVTAEIPVIGLSANALPVDIEKARSAGFNDYLTKPLQVPQFFATLEKWLPRDSQADFT